MTHFPPIAALQGIGRLITALQVTNTSFVSKVKNLNSKFYYPHLLGPDLPPAVPEVPVDRSLVQINVSNEELQQRIQNFIDKKREQVNLNNIHDFIPNKGENETEDADTCARVRTQFVRRSGSKGHLKVHKVNNEWGPQTVQNFPPMSQTESTGLPTAIAERVLDVEKFLNISGPVPKDIYKRLKDMEDKIAYLQAVSPEYAMFWKRHRDCEEVKQESMVDYTFSADDIARKIEQLERSNM